MRDWNGIRANTADTADDGASWALNPSLETQGEMQRRPGLEAYEPQSGQVIAPFWVPTGSYHVAFATADGQLIVLGTA